MSTSETLGSMPARKARRWRWIVILLLLIALPLAWLLYQRWLTERRLGELFAALDRDDPGWTLPEILAKRPTLEGENAADLVLSVSSEIPASFASGKVFEELEVPPPRLLEPRYHEAIKF